MSKNDSAQRCPICGYFADHLHHPSTIHAAVVFPTLGKVIEYLRSLEQRTIARYAFLCPDGVVRTLDEVVQHELPETLDRAAYVEPARDAEPLHGKPLNRISLKWRLDDTPVPDDEVLVYVTYLTNDAEVNPKKAETFLIETPPPAN